MILNVLTELQSSIMFDIWVHLQHKESFSPLQRCIVPEDSGSLSYYGAAVQNSCEDFRIQAFSPLSFEPTLVPCCRITASASYLLPENSMLPAVPQVLWAASCFHQHFLLLAYPHQFFPLLKAFRKSSVWSKLSHAFQVH